MALTMSPTLMLVVGAVAIYTLYTRTTLYLRRRAMKKQYGCEPCSATYNKDPFLGIDVLRESVQASKDRRFLSMAQNRFKIMKSTTYRSRMTTNPQIITIEPENVKTILSLRFKDYNFGHRTVAFNPMLGDGIFNSSGERWSNSRHMLRPNFAREQVADIAAFERHIKLLLKHIPKDGSTFDLQSLFFRFTLDTSTEFLFNHSTNSLRAMGDDSTSGDAAFGRAFGDANADMLRRIREGPLVWFRSKKTQREADEAIRMCHEYAERFVDEAIAWRKELEASGKAEDEKNEGSHGSYVFIRELVKQTTDRTRLRNELINVLLAGRYVNTLRLTSHAFLSRGVRRVPLLELLLTIYHHTYRDTTASLLSNMFFELSTKPELWAKLRQEVATLEGRLPTYEELRNLKLVKWCMNESLRLHPVVPNNARKAIRDTILPLGGGPDQKSPLFVSAGTVVGYHTYSMHHRTDYFGADAEEYRPERWETLRTGWEYLPFNGGPRICLGQQYALTEAGYVTVRLVQEFERMESRDTNGGVWVEGMTLTLQSGNGVLVGMVGDKERV
jgi:cytochrome P450